MDDVKKVIKPKDIRDMGKTAAENLRKIKCGRGRG